jgi:hypothetical protein
MILTILAAFLVWEVITRSVAAYLADTHPEVALRLSSTNPTALLNLADARLNPVPTPHRDEVDAPSHGETSQSSSDFNTAPSDQGLEHQSQSLSPQGSIPGPAEVGSETRALVRSWAELALDNDPLNARAFRILGQLSQFDSDNKHTQALMHAAVQRSLLESDAVYWMMRKSYESQDYRGALRYTDILFRTRPQVIESLMPVVGKLAEIPDGSNQLKQLLVTNPPWRHAFFKGLPPSVTDARTPLDIMLTLKDTSNPATTDDLSVYLNFLIEHQFYELAYYAWLQFLPREQLAEAGHLFNGSFETTPSGVPFDWVLTKGSGVTTQIAASNDRPGERAFFAKFGPGRVDYKDVTQLVLLAPGSYTFRGKYKADLVSERGLKWRVVCAGDETPMIGESQTINGSRPEWRDFEFSFTVPDTNCSAQYVRLVFDARSASEQFISGSIWFDDLQIMREAIAKVQE